MHYGKPSLSVEQQCNLLIQRDMRFTGYLNQQNFDAVGRNSFIASIANDGPIQGCL
jgi:hypothetical protein